VHGAVRNEDCVVNEPETGSDVREIMKGRLSSYFFVIPKRQDEVTDVLATRRRGKYCSRPLSVPPGTNFSPKRSFMAGGGAAASLFPGEIVIAARRMHGSRRESPIVAASALR
jgi:hypothetical protein